MSLVLIFCFTVTIIYLLNNYLFSYWTKQDVFQLEPQFIFGNAKNMFMLKEFFGDLFTNIYNENKQRRFVGGYLSYKPMLIINDPELIQDVLIRNFTTFHDRPTPGDAAENFPLIGSLLNLRGKKWRDLRIRLSPTFTSGKIKLMVPIMRDCGQVLLKYINKNIKIGRNNFDFKDLNARLTINIISSIAFGIENDCINEPDNVFRTTGLKIFEPTLRNGIINLLAFFLPDLFTKLKINPFLPEIEDFVYSLVNQTIEFREKNNFHRNDFMQLLIELKDKGFVSADKNSEHEQAEWEQKEINENNQIKKLTIDEIAAQAFVFFAGGFETSSSIMTFCLFELSKNIDIQRKVQDEIDQVMKSAGTEGITYELLSEMKYLDCCVDETLRKYPPAPVLFRTNTKNYVVPGTKVVIEKNTSVYIPIMGIQRDPNIFKDPMKFMPERFLDSPNGNPKIKSGIVYAPFGDGPRNCIGARFGKIQTKIGLAMMLQKFNFELQDKKLLYEELQFNPNSLLTTSLQSIQLALSIRN